MKALLVAAGLALGAAIPMSAVTFERAEAAATAEDLNRDADQALQILYRTNPVAQSIGKQARAVLVFPNIVKAGLVFGGAYGEGALMRGGRPVDYYNSFSGSWGLQAGVQSYGYVLFLMND
jgi:lipid-binding SYLF domain-containing protein